MRLSWIGLTVEIVGTPMSTRQGLAEGVQQPLHVAVWVGCPGRTGRQQLAELTAVVFAGHSHVIAPKTAISDAA
ncbi:hypothetical protein D9M70_413290 [compost metagenome]